MIKTFEEFVLECYNPVNEAFQSGKLREIIKQHGKPKHSWDNKMLYDLKDNEIIDVVNSRDEYFKKYSGGHDGQEAFMIELEDGSCIVIGNFGILTKFFRDNYKEKNRIFKERHSERHKGNLGKPNHIERTGDDINKKHIENVNKIEQRRLAEKLQPNIQEIVDNIKSILEEIDLSELIELGDDKHDNLEIESQMTIEGEKYDVYVYYSASIDEYKNRGCYEYDIEYELDKFEIVNYDSGISLSNDILGITYKTYKDLFKTYEEKDIDGGVYDPYEAYGVSPSDFF